VRQHVDRVNVQRAQNLQHLDAVLGMAPRQRHDERLVVGFHDRQHVVGVLDRALHVAHGRHAFDRVDDVERRQQAVRRHRVDAGVLGVGATVVLVHNVQQQDVRHDKVRTLVVDLMRLGTEFHRSL